MDVDEPRIHEHIRAVVFEIGRPIPFPDVRDFTVRKPQIGILKNRIGIVTGYDPISISETRDHA